MTSNVFKFRSCFRLNEPNPDPATGIFVLKDDPFEAAVIADYDAELAVERELVLRLASVLWRLRRATGIETSLFEGVTGKLEHGHSRPTLVEAADLSYQSQLQLMATRQSDTASETGFIHNAKKRISGTASCAWQNFRHSPWIALAATSICCGGKPARLCLRWSCCAAVNDNRAAQAFHFRSGGARPGPCPKSSDEHLRGQRRERVDRIINWVRFENSQGTIGPT